MAEIKVHSATFKYGCVKYIQLIWETFRLAHQVNQGKATRNRITVYVQLNGPGLPSADQVLCRAADTHISGHVEHPNGLCALVEVHHVPVLTVGPAVLRRRRVGFAGADQQGAAALLHHQGVDLDHHVFRGNWTA